MKRKPIAAHPSRTSRVQHKIEKREEPVAQLKPYGLLVILAVAAIATALGCLQVKIQFDARDYQIETRRLQELASVHRDEIRKLETRLGDLKRDENLREAALGPLGMVEPSPSDIRSLTIDDTRVQIFRTASTDAREAIESRRHNLQEEGKEVF